MRISHSLDSWLVYIHPPLAVLGYVMTFTLLFSFLMYRKDRGYRNVVAKTGWAAWTLNFLGLVTGMIWAQIAWGRPFAFDPKETFTLLLFLSVGLSLYLFHTDRDRRLIIASGVLSCLFIILTVAAPLIMDSLHGYS